MKPEEQRIAIAKACGWTCDPEEALLWGSRGQWVSHPLHSKGELVSKNMRLPDYLNDLNAMHEAEKVMSHDPLFSSYEAALDRVVPMSERWIFATASQRAEAFLRTLNLWTEN